MSLPLDVWIEELKDATRSTDITDLGEFLVEGVGYERTEEPNDWSIVFRKKGWYPLIFPLNRRDIPQTRLWDILTYIESRLREERRL